MSPLKCCLNSRNFFESRCNLPINIIVPDDQKYRPCRVKPYRRLPNIGRVDFFDFGTIDEKMILGQIFIFDHQLLKGDLLR